MPDITSTSSSFFPTGSHNQQSLHTFHNICILDVLRASNAQPLDCIKCTECATRNAQPLRLFLHCSLNSLFLQTDSPFYAALTFCTSFASTPLQIRQKLHTTQSTHTTIFLKASTLWNLHIGHAVLAQSIDSSDCVEDVRCTYKLWTMGEPALIDAVSRCFCAHLCRN